MLNRVKLAAKLFCKKLKYDTSIVSLISYFENKKYKINQPGLLTPCNHGSILVYRYLTYDGLPSHGRTLALETAVSRRPAISRSPIDRGGVTSA